MDKVIFRKAQQSDMEWLYRTFKSTMQSFIKQTWGWNEFFQHHSFHDNLPPSSFTIITVNGEDLGAYSLLRKKDHLWLEMVLVRKQQQGQGLGRKLLQHAQAIATEKQSHLRLNVLKVNPARGFYEHCGFQVLEEDQWSFKMQWAPPCRSLPL